jgi:hypothetical protein
MPVERLNISNNDEIYAKVIMPVERLNISNTEECDNSMVAEM